VSTDYTREEKIRMTAASLGIEWVPGRFRAAALQRAEEEKAKQLAKSKKRSWAMRNRASIALRNVNICAYCERTTHTNPDLRWEVDHVQPVSKGGADALHNMVKACKQCNGSKGSKLWKPRPGTMYADGHIEVSSVN
jgi:5-methylcytosine-specific restriction endonuclease McrA